MYPGNFWGGILGVLPEEYLGHTCSIHGAAAKMPFTGYPEADLSISSESSQGLWSRGSSHNISKLFLLTFHGGVIQQVCEALESIMGRGLESETDSDVELVSPLCCRCNRSRKSRTSNVPLNWALQGRTDRWFSVFLKLIIPFPHVH